MCTVCNNKCLQRKCQSPPQMSVTTILLKYCQDHMLQIMSGSTTCQLIGHHSTWGSLNICPHRCPSAPTLLVHIIGRFLHNTVSTKREGAEGHWWGQMFRLPVLSLRLCKVCVGCSTRTGGRQCECMYVLEGVEWLDIPVFLDTWYVCCRQKTGSVGHWPRSLTLLERVCGHCVNELCTTSSLSIGEWGSLTKPEGDPIHSIHPHPSPPRNNAM